MLGHEILNFAYMFLLGLFLFLVYMLVVLLKFITKKMLFLHIIFDMVFSAFAAVVYYYVAYMSDNGNVRAYGILGMMAGAGVMLSVLLLFKNILQKVFTNTGSKRKM